MSHLRTRDGNGPLLGRSLIWTKTRHVKFGDDGRRVWRTRRRGQSRRRRSTKGLFGSLRFQWDRSPDREIARSPDHQVTRSCYSPAVSGELHRTLRLPHATALVVGTIIGSAVFVQASEVTHHVPNIVGVLLVWIVSGILTLFGALACAELATAFPRTGGVYVFLREIYTPLVGFLWGWAMFWVMHSGIIAAMSMVFARYAGVFVPLDDRGMRAVAVTAILVNSAINYAGVKRSSTLQTSITATKVLAVALIVVVGFVLGSQLPSHYQYSDSGAASFGLSDVPLSEFLLAVVAGSSHLAAGTW